MNKAPTHIFHDDASRLGTASHGSERVGQVKGERGEAPEVYVFGPAEKALADRAKAQYRDTLAVLALRR